MSDDSSGQPRNMSNGAAVDVELRWLRESVNRLESGQARIERKLDDSSRAHQHDHNEHAEEHKDLADDVTRLKGEVSTRTTLGGLAAAALALATAWAGVSKQ